MRRVGERRQVGFVQGRGGVIGKAGGTGALAAPALINGETRLYWLRSHGQRSYSWICERWVFHKRDFGLRYKQHCAG